MSGNSRTCNLSISPTPFQPTLLSIPPSPFTPRTPLTPLLPSKPPTLTYPPSKSSAPSFSPLAWRWRCHQCHRQYNLSVTQRCLEDGHTFCSGSTEVKAWRAPVQQRKAKRYKACSSKFDFQSWKTWGRWRRSEHTIDENKKNCWMRCDYPSQCRWGRKIGVHTPITESFEIEAEPVVCSQQQNQVAVGGAEEAGAIFWDQVMTSAERRKINSATGLSSPLATIHEEVGDSDVNLSEDSKLTSISSNESTSLSPTKALDILKGFVKRKTSRHNLSREASFYNNIIPLEDQVYLSDIDAIEEGWAPLERVESHCQRKF
ncbi:hypothetical protein GQ44DRAFT_729788 [Phaeosphaeriaceae sp. PMI808]|nr:hypothetical protein GQ44DRAFT_729788 [Phaeosphaeriaceae sp. PMI808]